MLYHGVLVVLVACLLQFASTSSVGGWKSVENMDHSIQTIAKFASDVISDRSNSYYRKKLIHVHLAKRQLVAGWKYNVTFDLGTTICRKNEVSEDTVNLCTVSQNQVVERCTATVWERPWLKERQLLNYQCSPFKDYANYFSEANVAEDQAQHQQMALENQVPV